MAGQTQLQYPVDPIMGLFGIDAYQMDLAQAGGVAPATIIDPAKAWKATLKYRVGGAGATNVLLAGNTVVAKVWFYYEGHGGAADGTLNAAAIEVPVNAPIGGALDPVTNALEYEATVNVAADSLTPGLYTLSASVDFNTGMTRLLGFFEGPMVQVYGP